MVIETQRLNLVKSWKKKFNMYCEICFLLSRFIHIHIYPIYISLYPKCICKILLCFLPSIWNHGLIGPFTSSVTFNKE